VVQAVIDKGYRDFTGKVASARKQSVEQIDNVARGRVWSGAQAKERGLVDAFGGLHAAITDAAARAKLGKPDAYRVQYVEEPITPFEKFFGEFMQTRIGHAWFGDSAMIRGLLANKLPQMESDLRFLEGALKPGRGAPVKALVYCFCGF
jgi:protease-4